MKNAHLRFGHLVYTKAFKKTTTHFKLPLDRFIGESESGSQMKAHLISVIGGDTQIAALSAAVVTRDWFTIEAPDQTSHRVCLGANAECYRGSLQLEGQKRPLRHLVAVSEELAQLQMASVRNARSSFMTRHNSFGPHLRIFTVCLEARRGPTGFYETLSD